MNTATGNYFFRNEAGPTALGRAVGMAALAMCLSGAAVAQEAPARNPSKPETVGVTTGLVVGALAGGPFGAVIGAAGGAWLGDRYHKQTVAHQQLTSDLDRTQQDREQLTRNITQLNDSLSHEHERADRLDRTLSNTDEIGTDISFRTNDDSIPAQAMPPLLKLGALAASMPDATLRVAGYADPRGSQAYNDDLSRRRAEAVAAVLTAAGIGADRLLVEAHGSQDECGEGEDLDAYAMDRRVTVRLERARPETVASNE